MIRALASSVLTASTCQNSNTASQWITRLSYHRGFHNVISFVLLATATAQQLVLRTFPPYIYVPWRTVFTHLTMFFYLLLFLRKSWSCTLKVLQYILRVIVLFTLWLS
ncbi:uncharacterized protein BCR38DRAFT_13079 [Pseudomassariella vexata]|uniref:Uncharacterized protein n=1 Tax=Pseudomassariella vexata TaxID=1141098 RepID=A0A1Y2EJ16_9PEZI|nr:uncharacterized protein BCR38DRAFT_13079 [Pseudomassariella vexata]ORY71568.1 hypothetical protein BCR38DRAFT_13079 [Pseudomassariella vexata]